MKPLYGLNGERFDKRCECVILTNWNYTGRSDGLCKSCPQVFWVVAGLFLLVVTRLLDCSGWLLMCCWVLLFLGCLRCFGDTLVSKDDLIIKLLTQETVSTLIFEGPDQYAITMATDPPSHICAKRIEILELELFNSKKAVKSNIIYRGSVCSA